MNSKQLVQLLYNMSCDMDQADYTETAEIEITAIAEELQALHDVDMPFLRTALERIAEMNR